MIREKRGTKGIIVKTVKTVKTRLNCRNCQSCHTVTDTWVADRSVLRNDGKECSAGTQVILQEGNKSKSNYTLGTTGWRLEMEVGDEVQGCRAGDVGFKTRLQLVCCALAC